MDISDALSTAYTDPVLKHVLTVLDDDAVSDLNHRTVRTNAERRVLNHTGQVLEQLRPLSSSLESIGSSIARASAVYSEMRSIVLPYSTQLNSYAREAEFSQGETKRLESSRATLDAYMKTLYISPEEKNVLESGKLDDSFFEVLNRVRDIHSQGAAALLAESPSAGELLMHESSKLLDTAYNRIKTSVEQELSSGGTSNLRKYMGLLAERPLLFKTVLSSESSARKTRLSREFAQFIAHEQSSVSTMPLGYLSSVLAWVHAAIVNEFEHISLLFDSQTENKQLENLLNTSDTQQVIAELVDGVLSTIESPLRQRVTSLVVAQTSLGLVDELQNVLDFYEQMLRNQFSMLKFLEVLTQLNASIDRQFEHLLSVQRPSWEQRVDTARDVVITHDKGLGSNIAESRVALLLDDSNSQAKQGESKQGESAFEHIEQLNKLDYAVTHLAGYTTALAILEKLQQTGKKHESALVALEVEALKKNSSFTEFQAQALSAREFGIAFDRFLAQFDGEASLTDLESPTIAHRISSAAIEQFLNEYEFATRDTQLRSAEEVRSILT